MNKNYKQQAKCNTPCRRHLRSAIMTVVLSTGLVSAADAALLSRSGGQAYYDDVAGLTWLADANYAQTSGYAAANADGAVNSSPTNIQADGRMGWQAANAWAASLSVNGVSGWRLPDTLQPDSSCDNNLSGFNRSSGLNCTGSEMGGLFYTALGNTAESLTETGPFSNLQTSNYWSATSFDENTNFAWSFNMSNGYQGIPVQLVGSKSDSFYGWAVQSGDIGVVPVPAAVWLFSSGLLGLIGIARRNTGVKYRGHKYRGQIRMALT